MILKTLRMQFMLSYRGEFDKYSSKYHKLACFIDDILYKFSVQNEQIFYNIVEKLCESLCNKLRTSCELFSNILWKSRFYVVIMWKKGVLHCFVDKFSIWFLARSHLCKTLVLHSIHKPYNYDYYLFIERRENEN